MNLLILKLTASGFRQHIEDNFIVMGSIITWDSSSVGILRNSVETFVLVWLQILGKESSSSHIRLKAILSIQLNRKYILDKG